MQGYSGISDEELILKYQSGEELAIEELFERYKQVVRKKAKAMFLVGGDSDDLIQEGMIGLYKAVKDYDDKKDASFYTFASLCINRQILNAVTASNRKKYSPLNSYVSLSHTSDDDNGAGTFAHDELSDNTGNPETLLIDRVNAMELEQNVLGALSTFEQEVLKLYMSGKDYNEIAKELGKSAKSIDNAIQRIRNKVDKIANL